MMNQTTTKAAPGKREARKMDRRQAIVAVARRSFLDDGYAATSMSSLSTTLGGSKATLWSYFRSKEELFAAVVEDVTSAIRVELEGVLLTSGDVEETLTTFCHGFLSKTAHPDAVSAWRLIAGESGRFPELGRIFYETVAHRVEVALAAYIASLITVGRLRDEGAMHMAQMLLGLCATHHNKRLWGITSDASGELAADAARFAKYFLKLFARDDK